jgi:murein DD-endopeptidase / murein LD-carboxypeptidase
MTSMRLAWILVVASLTAACATSRAVPRPFPGSGVETPGPEPLAVVRPNSPDDIIRTALALRGTPYRNGGTDPTGFDCSGFVQYVFAQHGVALPREVREQFRAGEPVRRTSIEPGDLVFFTTDSRGPSHVGVAIDSHRFVHAPSSRGSVRVERYSDEYWSSRLLGARRVSSR